MVRLFNLLQVFKSVKATQKVLNYSERFSLWLNRTSGLALNVKAFQVDFSSTFREVLHNVSDNSKLGTNPDVQKVLNEFCQQPVPDYYEVQLKQLRRDVPKVKGTDKPCPDYRGNQKTSSKAPKGLRCIGSDNSLMKMFGVTRGARSPWKEERTRTCYDALENCEKCRKRCTVQADPVCSIATNDWPSKKEYGQHFTYCFDCCFQTSCACPTCPCQRYKDNNCFTSQVTCVNETEYDVTLKPIFPRDGAFMCHLVPLRGPGFVLETTVEGWQIRNGSQYKGTPQEQESRREKQRRFRLSHSTTPRFFAENTQQ